VKVLVDAEANLNLIDADGRSALHAAAQEGSAEVITILVCAKAKLNLVDKSGYTPLISAASKGHATCISLLLGAGAELETKNKHGETARDAAEADKNGQWKEVVKLLDAYAATTSVSM